ncbi:hypothetical protein [Streptomyces mayteni]
MAVEDAPEPWLQSADVVIGATPRAVRAARQAGGSWLRALPGCRLVATPALGDTAVLSAQDDQVVVTVEGKELRRYAVEVCLWLMSGHRLAELPTPAASAPAGGSRGS